MTRSSANRHKRNARALVAAIPRHLIARDHRQNGAFYEDSARRFVSAMPSERLDAERLDEVNWRLAAELLNRAAWRVA